MSLTWLGPVRGGVTKMGKNFFAFLDELDHLEATGVTIVQADYKFSPAGLLRFINFPYFISSKNK